MIMFGKYARRIKQLEAELDDANMRINELKALLRALEQARAQEQRWSTELWRRVNMVMQ